MPETTNNSNRMDVVDVSLGTPNAETIAAMQEAERIGRDLSIKGYTDAGKMMKELNT